MARGIQQKKSEKLRTFSERFRSALRRSNFQDNEIAEKMGVAPSAISNWRQGLNMAKGKNLRRLAEVLNCRPGWLLGEEENEDTDVLRRGQTPYGKDTWQERALSAEKRLADLRAGLRLLLEASADFSPPQEKPAASSLAVSAAAETSKTGEGQGNLRAPG
jgi:transcriptional regulator with XRE-family HTH domain